jgi:hypothetical protein
MAYHRKKTNSYVRMVAYNGFLEIKPWYKQWYYWWYTHVYFGHNIEKKNTEEQLRISETAFRGNFENAAIGMAFIDTMAGG